MSSTIPTPTTVDLLILGAGPAGLSTALTFSRLRRSCLIYDSGLYRNGNVKVSHTVPAYDGSDPAEWRRKARKEIEMGYGEWTTFRDAKVIELRKVDGKGEGGGVGEGWFDSIDEQGGKVRARKVVLATGITDNLPAIPGLEAAWGSRAIHCIFCHGTETRGGSFAFLFTRSNAKMNPMFAESIFKLWSSLGHSQIYLLLNGMQPDEEEAGLGTFRGMIENKGYEIITAPLTSIEESPTTLTISFTDHPTLDVPYIAVLPESWTPHNHATSLLTPDLLKTELSPTGTIAPPQPADLPAGLPFRMGDDPRTAVKGLFWAGNSGSFMGNVNVSVAQGQMAGFMAGEELGKEDMARM